MILALITQLEEEGELMNRVLDELTVHLQEVTKVREPVPPSVETAIADGKPEEIPTSPLAVRLQSQISNMRAFRSRIEEIAADCEL